MCACILYILSDIFKNNKKSYLVEFEMEKYDILGNMIQKISPFCLACLRFKESEIPCREKDTKIAYTRNCTTLKAKMRRKRKRD